MIVPTMTQPELFKELSREMDYIRDMVSGIRTKYSRQMRIKSNGILGLTRYVSPRHNIVWCLWCRDWTGKLTTISSVVMIEYTDEKNSRNYIMPQDTSYGMSTRVSSCLIFSGHCMTRIRERGGMDFKEFMRYSYGHHFRYTVQDYEYNGKTVKATALGDMGLMLCEEEPWGMTCKTFVSNNLLGSNQIKHEEMVINRATELGEEMDRINDQISHENLATFNRAERRRILRGQKP